MIRAIALDDEPPALEIIQTFCSRMENIELKKTFTSTAEAFGYVESHPVDLILLDINMPSVSGIEFYKKLSHRVMVVFTTSYSEYAVESYELNAIDYLVKPFSFDRFKQAIRKAYDFHTLHRPAPEPRPEHLVLKLDYGLVKMSLNTIEFIEGQDNYCKIHCKDDKPVIVRLTMKVLLEMLPPADFIRVHRSYIVPLARVKLVRNKTIFLVNGAEIPLGSSYEELFKTFFNK